MIALIFFYHIHKSTSIAYNMPITILTFPLLKYNIYITYVQGLQGLCAMWILFINVVVALSSYAEGFSPWLRAVMITLTDSASGQGTVPGASAAHASGMSRYV